jgi:hypothetical protein
VQTDVTRRARAAASVTQARTAASPQTARVPSPARDHERVERARVEPAPAADRSPLDDTTAAPRGAVTTSVA